MEHFDLTTLSRRTGISLAKLEYGLSQKWYERDWLLPENPPADLIDDVEGVYLTMATHLLDSGCSGEAIRWLMNAIANFYLPDRNSLHLPLMADAISSRQRASVQLADGTHVRWKIGNDDTGWCRYSPTVLPEAEYQPCMIIAFDVARIRNLVRGVRTSS